MNISNVKQLINQKRSEISFLLIIFIAITIPFKVNYGNIAIILATVFLFFNFRKENFRRLKKFGFIFPFLFFLITIISSLFSHRFDLGIKRTDLELLPVLLVFILIVQKRNYYNTTKVLEYFFKSTVIFTSILIVVASYNFIFRKSEVTFHEFTSLYDQHPVYFSMYISLSLFYVFFKDLFKKKNLQKSISVVILLIGLFLCASKAVIFIDIVLFVIMVFLSKRTFKNKLFYLTLLIILCSCLLSFGFLRNRFSEGLSFSSETLKYRPTNNFLHKKQFSYEEKENISDIELRYIFLKTMLFHIIEDERFFFGYGQGDTQDYIDYYYHTYNLAPNWYEDYNVHNQYLHLTITYGVFVLIFFLVYLIYCYKIAIENNDKLYLFFLILCSFILFFEVLLVRNKGIIFFYFFNTLFLTKNLNFENSNIRHKRNTKLSWRF